MSAHAWECGCGRIQLADVLSCKCGRWRDERKRELVCADRADPVEPGVSERELTALLPGVHYMDPPDGGDVSVMEQLRRMATDAARWRYVEGNAMVQSRSLHMDGTKEYQVRLDLPRAPCLVDAIDKAIAASAPPARPRRDDTSGGRKE